MIPRSAFVAQLASGRFNWGSSSTPYSATSEMARCILHLSGRAKWKPLLIVGKSGPMGPRRAPSRGGAGGQCLPWASRSWSGVERSPSLHWLPRVLPRRPHPGPLERRRRTPIPGRSWIPTASPAITRSSAQPDLRSTLWTPRKPGANPEIWERVIAKLRAGSMPPPGMPRPDAAAYRAVASSLENEIDRAWEASPNPGRISAVHRLNRAEYNNAIRDLFALDLDVKPLLPGDETADGSFDNFADSLSISTAHLERYLSVARQVTRLATGLPPTSPTARDGSRFRCTCCKTTGRAKTCRWDRAAASRFTTTFRSTAST